MSNFRFSSFSGNMIPKFYKLAFCPSESAPYTIYLDKKQLKTPNKNIISVPSKLLAWSICQEFNSQIERVNTVKLPIFGMTRTAIDAQNEPLVKNNLIERITKFYQNDTIYYWENQQTVLGKLQKKNLQPVINFMDTLLRVQTQPQIGFQLYQNIKGQNLDTLVDYLNKYDCYQLTSLEMLCSLFKSTSISIMLLHNVITVEEAIQKSMIEENYQISKFGFVEGSHDLDISYINMMSYSAKIFHDFSQFD